MSKKEPKINSKYEKADSKSEIPETLAKDLTLSKGVTIPFGLSESILVNIPDEDFKDPTKKFCHNCILGSSIINILFSKLDDGLKSFIRNSAKRKKHIFQNMLYGITSVESVKDLYSSLYPDLNIFKLNTLNNEEIENMLKFDYIIQNPPYKGSLHLDILEKSLDLIKNDGKIIIIEPATWLINLRKNGKANIYDRIKSRLKNHVSRVVIENYNKEFGTSTYVPFSITFIDFSKEYSEIEFECCGVKSKEKSLYDCNLIGKYDTVWSIFNKCLSYKDMMKSHVTNEEIEDNYYLAHSDILTMHSYHLQVDYVKRVFGTYMTQYTAALLHKHYTDIVSVIHHSRSKNSNKFNCVYGTKEELENWKYYVLNNKLPLFLSLCLTIDQHNNVKDFVPFLVDKKHTDEEIYDKFKFTEEERDLIEFTIKKFEVYSPWFKRLRCGVSEVTNEEVNDFIDKLK